ncbi:hypothetical protein SAMN05216226_10149 [Halovenus aranensis]|jgi:hypothetical protein|uniref:Uncharacterized protein n=1 Tax=Halovenus aranensis TaxID=890420 RepID=A0A1G8RPZ5_9EURY|nr:hypothetical protein [Halovenus aranensis]SDJ19061.1 hypothetical protein SAMN05216226_10149 [Halovenus aranensis]
MEFEAPVDAWYVWFGVAVASLAITGVALSLPTQPPPDAAQAANAIDRVAGSTQVATATVNHAAEEVRLGTSRISMRNDGGTVHATLAFGPVTPVTAVGDATARHALQSMLHGTPPAEVLGRTSFDALTESELQQAVASARERRRNRGPQWRQTSGRLRVHSVHLDGELVVLVGS